jgi:hypothetical protein
MYSDIDSLVALSDTAMILTWQLHLTLTLNMIMRTKY